MSKNSLSWLDDANIIHFLIQQINNIKKGRLKTKDKNQKWTFLDEPSDQRSSAVLCPIIFYLSIGFSVL